MKFNLNRFGYLLRGKTLQEFGYRVTYDGDALQEHRMDVRDLAPALLAHADLFERSVGVISDGKVQAKAQVKGSFKKGSFCIDVILVQSLVESAKDLFTVGPFGSNPSFHIDRMFAFIWGEYSNAVKGAAMGVTGVWTVNSLFGLIKKLNGHSISDNNIDIIDNEHVKVTINDDEFTVEKKVIDLYKHHEIRKAMEAAIARPLNKEGIEKFYLDTQDELNKDQDSFTPLALVDEDEVSSFIVPEMVDDKVERRITKEELQILSVSFTEGNKWRFSDGQSKFSASITDIDFMQKIKLHKIEFKDGDRILAKVLIETWMDSGQLKKKREIIEVLRHKHTRVEQTSLDFDS